MISSTGDQTNWRVRQDKLAQSSPPTTSPSPNAATAPSPSKTAKSPARPHSDRAPPPHLLPLTCNFKLITMTIRIRIRRDAVLRNRNRNLNLARNHNRSNTVIPSFPPAGWQAHLPPLTCNFKFPTANIANLTNHCSHSRAFARLAVKKAPSRSRPPAGWQAHLSPLTYSLFTIHSSLHVLSPSDSPFSRMNFAAAAYSASPLRCSISSGGGSGSAASRRRNVA